MRLNSSTLDSLPPEVAVPSYDRSELRTGIVHLGVGGFHRAHQARYLDELMNAGQALDWALCGVGILPGDAKMRDVLAEQDGLYTLVEKDADGTWSARVIGAIHQYLFAPDDPEAVVELMASPDIKIVSLTVTEGGYNVHAVTGEFVADDPGVVHDLEPDATPTTSFGLVVEALVRRRERGVPPFTVMSCDNIAGNGHVAKLAFAAFAELRDPELGEWVRTDVHFPNSMVDRITPVTTDDDIAEITERFGIEDAWPVVCEPFTQWVLEDSFTDGRPPFEDVGVQVVDDVEPYELMKLRLLNASHQALCYLGYLAGYRLVHEVAQDEAFAAFLLAYMDREATPTLPPVPGIDLDEYKHTLIERFSNAGVRDTVPRLCAESSDRVPKWLLPVVRWNLEHDGPVELSAAVVASWARYAEGTDEKGEPIEIVDRLADRVHAAAQRYDEQPLAFLSDRELFGDLIEQPRFTDAYRSALDALHADGAEAVVREYSSHDAG